MSRLAPQRFGKYVLLRRIALGGMAEIFKAKVAGAEGFEKDLVIKRILPHFSDDDSFVQMFVDEARITSKLQHTNIVQIFDFDVIDGSYYIAMEYIEGKDLKDVCEESVRQGEPLSVAQCASIAAEIAKGLHYAHTREDKGEPLNIVHRDVTPSNVMITYRGDVKLMDFGIAKATQRSTKTQAGAVKGKVAYMSPEQARGKPIDGRTDIFALGVMLWEMLTGARLFLAESDFDTLNNVLKMEAPPPSSLNHDCPPDLDPIVLKCLEKDANQRWANAEQLNRELTRWYFQNVADLEKEKLKPLMYRIFKGEIDRLEQVSAEDDALMSGAPSQYAEATSREVGAADAGPPSEQATRVGAGLTPGAEPTTLGPSQATATRAASTHTASGSLTPVEAQRRRASQLPWILLVLLLLGGGTATVLLVMRNNNAPTPSPGTATVRPTTVAGADASEPTGAKSAVLSITVDPPSARIKVDGAVVGAEVATTIGQRVSIVAEAPGYKRFEDIISIDDKAPVYTIKMEKEGVRHRVVIKPSSEEDEVFADDKRLGVGAQPFEGLVGQKVFVRAVSPTGGPGVTKVVTLDESMVIVDVATPAELVVTVSPADATVTASAGKVEPKDAGVVAVRGLERGKPVTIEVKAKEHKPARQEVLIDRGSQALTVKLDKIDKTEPTDLGSIIGGNTPRVPGGNTNNTPKVPGGNTNNTPKVPGGNDDPAPVSVKGSIMVSARPWAQVRVNGRPYGTTPTQIKDLSPGSYTVVLTKGQQTVTKTVTIAGGKQAQVYVDFTEM